MAYHCSRALEWREVGEGHPWFIVSDKLVYDDLVAIILLSDKADICIYLIKGMWRNGQLV
jgi:hypothetical protein